MGRLGSSRGLEEVFRSLIGLLYYPLVALVVGVLLISVYSIARADANLVIQINTSYNLVVDSNVSSPSTAGPDVATITANFCNSGDRALRDVQGYIGDFAAGTPGVYPRRDSSLFNPVDPLYNTGTYAFNHVGGSQGLMDATRYIGDIAPGECKAQYWHFSYPQCSNNETPPCSGVPVWGASIDPSDDLWLTFDVWGSGYDAVTSAAVNDNTSWTMNLRNTISAMANKIKPNPDGQWFNTASDTVLPGETITSNGINYELGNINQGFDNNGDLIPDFNAWLQPIGEANFDPGCFRLVGTSGVLTVTRSAEPDLLIPFDDQLYFTDLPPNNTGVTGRVYYTFLALDGPCSTALTPYQEVASGFDNEKFNSDYGTGIPPIGSFEPEVTIDKSSSPNTIPGTGGTITYSIPVYNSSASGSVGLPLNGMALTVVDSIPPGTQFNGSVSYSGYGTATVLYSTDNRATWSSVMPGDPTTVTDLQWRLDDPLPAGQTGTAAFQVTVPSGYSLSPVIENTACARFGDGPDFACDTTYTLVEGPNSIGDRVWDDLDVDGLQDPGETAGIGNITVNLYWDRDGDGELGEADVLLTTTVTNGSGIYSFANLPDGDFLAVLDNQDADVPDGYDLSTPGVHAVVDLGVGIPGGVAYTQADFGLAPALRVVKSLVSINPAYEGEQVTFNIRLTNTRPGDGTPQGYCTYTAWAAAADPSHPPQNSGRYWTLPGNAYSSNGADDLFAYADFGSGADNQIAGMTYSIGNQTGAITSVEVLFRVYLSQALVNDQAAARLYLNNDITPLGTITFNTAQLNAFAGGLGNVGYLTWDVSAVRSWSFADFAGDLNLQFENTKNASPDVGLIYMDAMGFRITTDQSCGDPSDVIQLLPLTDTYDPSMLSFVSANPSESSVDVGAGTITWDNLGPLYPGGTKVVSVVFTALEPPTLGPNTTQNTASVTEAEFLDGLPVNDASDDADVTILDTGSIGDRLWNDNGNGGGTAANGIQDGGEVGIPGVIVNLYRNGSLFASTVTDANGDYLFTALHYDKGEIYYVAIDTASLPGSTFTQTGDPDAPGVNCDPPGPRSNCDNQSNNITLTAANDDVLGTDFGYLVPNTVFGNVWEDLNGNGAQQTGENGLSGVTVRLYNCGADGTCGNADDQVAGTQTTDADGDYLFSDLADRSYYTVVDMSTLPPGGSWTNTYDPDGNLDSRSPVIAVSGGNIYGSYDFGYHQSGNSSIGDRLYYDWDGDGTQDAAEPGIEAVTVYLYRDNDGDGLLDSGTDFLMAVITTTANGDYLFPNLPAGDYIVVVDEGDPDFPASLLQTQDPDEVGLCSTCDGRSWVENVDGVSNYLDEDFGYQPTGAGAIGDRVWLDADADRFQDAGEVGLANITVNLYADLDGDGVYDPGSDPLVAAASTDVDGIYGFSFLPAGNYLVDVDTADLDLPPGLQLSTGNDLLPVALAANQSYQEADFGFAPGARVGNLLWRDDNADGIPGVGEPGIPSVTVYLCATSPCDSGNALSTAVTDVNGGYEFTSLPAGDYVIAVDTATLPAGYLQTGDPDLSGVCSGTVCDSQSAFTLSLGQVDYSRDFGYRPGAVIGDYIWLDSNADGIQDASEAGLGGLTVTLTPPPGIDLGNGPGNPISTLTDAFGYYFFANLPAGTGYSLTVSPPANTTLTYAVDGGVDSTVTFDVSGGNVINLGACVGDCTLAADFGYCYFGNNSLSGVVYHDNDDNAIYDPTSETVTYAGVPIYLFDDSNQLIAITVTNPAGTYVFTNLPDGQYTVSVNPNVPNLDGLLPTITSSPTTTYVVLLDLLGNNPNPVDDGDNHFGFYSYLDMGDLPDTYVTVLNVNGARHLISATPGSRAYLGSSVDAESDGLATVNADGDDNAGSDDEEGVLRTPGVNWRTGPGGGSVDITVVCPAGNSCYVSAWIDWDRDGYFDAIDENVAIDQAVNNGTQTVLVDVPGSVTFGASYYVRFRLYASHTGGAASPVGLVINGEVEDYLWQFGPTAVTLSGQGAYATAQAPGALLWAAVILLVSGGSLTAIVKVRRERDSNHPGSPR